MQEPKNLGVVDALYSLRRVLPSTNKIEDLYVFLNSYFALEDTDDISLYMAQLLALQWLHDNLIAGNTVRVNDVTVNWIKIGYKQLELQEDDNNPLKKISFSLNVIGSRD